MVVTEEFEETHIQEHDFDRVGFPGRPIHTFMQIQSLKMSSSGRYLHTALTSDTSSWDIISTGHKSLAKVGVHL
jgi:hypothetical protein